MGGDSHLLLAAVTASDSEGVLFGVDIGNQAVVADVVVSDRSDERIRQVTKAALSIVRMTSVGEEGGEGGRVVHVRVGKLRGRGTLRRAKG